MVFEDTTSTLPPKSFLSFALRAVYNFNYIFSAVDSNDDLFSCFQVIVEWGWGGMRSALTTVSPLYCPSIYPQGPADTIPPHQAAASVAAFSSQKGSYPPRLLLRLASLWNAILPSSLANSYLLCIL